MGRTKARAAAIVVLVLAMLSVPAVAASASYNRWYLRYSNTTGVGQAAFTYGDGTQTPLAGDWNGDGRDTPGLFQSSTGRWWLSDTLAGTTQAYFAYGSPGMSPVVGDWNGDRRTSVGVKTGGRWHLTNSNSSAPASSVFTFGNPSGDIPVSGDWDGNGTSTPGIYRTTNRAYYLSNSPTGSLVSGIAFGIAGDVPIVGDWNGDGRDSIGVYRPSNGGWYLSNGLDGTAEIVFAYGNPYDRPVVGDWDGNGTDTPAVVRSMASSAPPSVPSTEVSDSLQFSVEIPDDADDLAADADDSEPYSDEDDPESADDAALAVSERSAQRWRTEEGTTASLALDPDIEVGASAASFGPGGCTPSRKRRRGFKVFRPVRLTADYDYGYTTNQMRVFKQNRADRVYYPNLGRTVTVKDFIGCVTGGAQAYDGWKLKHYYNVVFAKTEIERLLLPARWGRNVEGGQVTASLGVALNAGVVSINAAVQSSDRDRHDGAIGPFCWVRWSGGPCYPVWPEYEKNMVRSFWEGSGLGSSYWQGNTVIAQYQLPQSRRNIKLDFNVFTHWLSVGG